MQEIVTNAITGTSTVRTLSAEEQAEREAMAAQAAQELAAVEAADADLRTRRQALVGELQTIRDATGWAGARAPLLRVLVFILRRLGERDS